VADRDSPQKHVWRARIILATGEGCGTAEIMRRAGVSKPSFWRWQRRFMEAGVDGCCATRRASRGCCLAGGGRRPGGRAELGRAACRDDALDRPGHGGPHRHLVAVGAADLGGTRARAARVRRFKLTKDPAFAAKLRDVVGLYLDPPAHSLVLSVDEKSQIQALDRTQPGLPIKRGRAGTMTHDYVRHRTTTLFAALNLLDGTVIGQCMQRHRHQEFIRFLNRVEAVVPAGKLVHAILDIYVAHKHPKVCAWLVRHPRWTFHFTPTSCSASLAIRDILFPALGARGNAAECGRSGLFGPFFVSVGGAFL
jgi:DDE superfamily endonuclease/Homeodomain-like domain